jgi:hypothetical protein
MLSIVFHKFLNSKTSNKKYTLKNEYIYLFPKFQNSPRIFKQLSSVSLLNLFSLYGIIHYVCG